MKASLTLLVLMVLSAAPAQAADTSAGKKVFDKWCFHCHGPDPEVYPGTVALSAKYNGNVPPALEDRTDLTAELITHYVRKGFSMMPHFRKTEVSDKELQALIDYLTTPTGER